MQSLQRDKRLRTWSDDSDRPKKRQEKGDACVPLLSSVPSSITLNPSLSSFPCVTSPTSPASPHSPEGVLGASLLSSLSNVQSFDLTDSKTKIPSPPPSEFTSYISLFTYATFLATSRHPRFYDHLNRPCMDLTGGTGTTCEWTIHDDGRLYEFVDEGKEWKEISEEMNKTEYSCYIRWNKELQPAMGEIVRLKELETRSTNSHHAPPSPQNRVNVPSFRRSSPLNPKTTFPPPTLPPSSTLKSPPSPSPVPKKRSSPKNPKPLQQTPPKVKGAWTSSEDSIILRYVSEHAPKNGTFSQWTSLAGHLESKGYHRVGKQTRERYKNLLDPTLNTSLFTSSEDYTLFCLHKKYGSKWVQISKCMDRRSENSLKNRFNSKTFGKKVKEFQSRWEREGGNVLEI